MVFSFGRIKQPQGTMRIYVAGIAEIKKIDDHTVDFMLSGPNPLLLRNIIDFRIMSKSWSEKNKTTNVQDYKAKEDNYASRNVNGTGSYKITGWTPDQRITMVAATRTGGTRPTSNVTEVIYTPIKSDPTRVAALLSGDVDMLTDLPTQDVARLRSDQQAEDRRRPRGAHDLHRAGPVQPRAEVQRRQGQEPVQGQARARGAEPSPSTARRSSATPCAACRSRPASWSRRASTATRRTSTCPPRRTPSAPRSCWPTPATRTASSSSSNCPNNRYVNDEEICQNLVGMWARIGVKTKLVAESMATFIQKVQNFDTSAYLLGWGVATFDAQYTLQSLIRTRTTGADGNFNFNRISEPKLDALVDAMKTETDVAKRNAHDHATRWC